MPLRAQLGDITFRINPSQVSWDYRLDTSVTPTIGGRVVQVYGATLGDITVQGLFGEDRAGKQASGFMAEKFQRQIADMVVAQSKVPSKAQLAGIDDTPMHPSFRFLVTGDGVHNWDFQVYVKSLTDVNDGSVTVSHKTGKFSYGYNLVLFIVEDNTGVLKKVASDDYIKRLSEGLGWQKSTYNGQMSKEDLDKYLQANSPDGTLHGLVLKEFQDVSQGTLPGLGVLPGDPIPGGVDTAGQIQGGGLGGSVAPNPAPGTGGTGGAAPITNLPGGGTGIGGNNGGPAIVLPGVG